MVSGVVALMLSKNDKLTWRDVKHILVESSFKPREQIPSGWSKEGGSWPITKNTDSDWWMRSQR